jgi:hypothetical protein
VARPRWRAVAGGVGAVIAALAIWLVWPSSPGVPGADRVRQYLAFRACLLTGARGITGGDAAAAWSGMQQASLATRAMVSYLPVLGPATRTTAVPYLASLAHRVPASVTRAGRGRGHPRGVRYQAATAPANCSGEELPTASRDVLLALCLDENAEVRFSAIFELGSWWLASHDARIKSALTRALADDDPLVARAARDALTGR